MVCRRRACATNISCFIPETLLKQVASCCPIIFLPSWQTLISWSENNSKNFIRLRVGLRLLAELHIIRLVADAHKKDFPRPLMTVIGQAVDRDCHVGLKNEDTAQCVVTCVFNFPVRDLYFPWHSSQREGTNQHCVHLFSNIQAIQGEQNCPRFDRTARPVLNHCLACNRVLTPVPVNIQHSTITLPCFPKHSSRNLAMTQIVNHFPKHNCSMVSLRTITEKIHDIKNN